MDVMTSLRGTIQSTEERLDYWLEHKDQNKANEQACILTTLKGVERTLNLTEKKYHRKAIESELAAVKARQGYDPIQDALEDVMYWVKE